MICHENHLHVVRISPHIEEEQDPESSGHSHHCKSLELSILKQQSWAHIWKKRCPFGSYRKCQLDVGWKCGEEIEYIHWSCGKWDGTVYASITYHPQVKSWSTCTKSENVIHRKIACDMILSGCWSSSVHLFFWGLHALRSYFERRKWGNNKCSHRNQQYRSS